MHTFSIKVSTESESAYNSMIDALAENYGYSETELNPQFTLGGNAPMLIPNSEAKEDFIRRKIIEEMTLRVKKINLEKFTAESKAQAESIITQAANSFSVSA